MKKSDSRRCMEEMLRLKLPTKRYQEANSEEELRVLENHEEGRCSESRIVEPATAVGKVCIPSKYCKCWRMCPETHLEQEICWKS